ncbi:MAG: hypothetical protein HY860_05445 [Chlamydiales bacterium]|nr:hypothetical protein [Chlamydiales bacterium]
MAEAFLSPYNNIHDYTTPAQYPSRTPSPARLDTTNIISVLDPSDSPSLRDRANTDIPHSFPPGEYTVIHVKPGEDIDSDEDDDAFRNPPSMWKQTAVTASIFAGTILAIYFNAPTLSIVPLAQLWSTAGKTSFRNLSQKQRYAIATLLVITGFTIDYFSPIKLSLGPTTTFLVVNVASRTMKSIMLGKPSKDEGMKTRKDLAKASKYILPTQTQQKSHKKKLITK